MLKNYFKTALRNIQRNKVFAFINIIGLSIGISASLVIYLVVSYDFSFDRSHKDGDRIYRVVTHSINEGEDSYISGVTYPLADAMRRELSGLDFVAPFFTWNLEKLSVPGADKGLPTVFKSQRHIVFADENYFRLIRYEWLAGSPKTSLSQPYQVVLTVSNARTYFPGLSPDAIIGRRIYFNDSLGTVVTGIVKELPYNTDFTFKTFISRVTLEKTNENPAGFNWGPISGASRVLLKLSKGVGPAEMERKMTALLKKHGINSNPDDPNKTFYKLQPLSDLHFNHLYGNFFGYDEMASKPALYSLLAVAIFLLVLACINFINLTTAQSSQRAKEIGVRKTIGSSRRQLIFQFLSETFVLTLLATLLSILLIPVLLRTFADFIPQRVHFSMILRWDILVFVIMLLMVVSLLSGLYPALVLSSYRAAQVLKNQVHVEGGQSHRAWLRKTLTVSQFVVAQVFVMATLLVSKQINYTLNKDLGFKKDAIIYFYTSFNDRTRNHQLELLDNLKSIPGISIVSLASDAPFSNESWRNVLKYKGDKKELKTEVTLKYADTNYCRLYHLKLIAGKGLPSSDTPKAVLINETYMHILGFRNPQEATGKSIYLEDDKELPIVGVVADFHQSSLHIPIKPIAITSEFTNEQFISIALTPQSSNGNSWKTVIANMQRVWEAIYPDDDFNYKFQDEEIAKTYKSEQDIARLLAWATGLAIIISCLGLLGSVIYVTNQRTKEIGIRKILGATVTQIISLLSADFLKLVAFAFLIAVPVAWWGSHAWLNNFAYRTDLSWWIFLAGGLVMGGIAFVILLLQTFKASIANPADTLRTE